MYSVALPEFTNVPTLAANVEPGAAVVESSDTTVSSDCGVPACGATMCAASAMTPRSTWLPSASTA